MRNVLVRDLKIRTLNKCPRSILCKNSRLNVLLNRTGKCCSNPANTSTKNVLDEVNFQLVTGKHPVLLQIIISFMRRFALMCRG